MAYAIAVNCKVTKMDYEACNRALRAMGLGVISYEAYMTL